MKLVYINTYKLIYILITKCHYLCSPVDVVVNKICSRACSRGIESKWGRRKAGKTILWTFYNAPQYRSLVPYGGVEWGGVMWEGYNVVGNTIQ